VPGVRGFVAVDNVGDTKYQINLSSTAPNALVSQGMPRTVRVGVQVSRF
jgi:outer membrane receptor protein involved in Fe transport